MPKYLMLTHSLNKLRPIIWSDDSDVKISKCFIDKFMLNWKFPVTSARSLKKLCQEKMYDSFSIIQFHASSFKFFNGEALNVQWKQFVKKFDVTQSNYLLG